ncbi:aspartate:alanine exchanger family transporter [Sorangium sp. So ce693]|uniref:aspartate:alanine exchanger family transporter n=1 Tax=Sorangium sp. So ce693 TaxID=3133318 RepID=UPI003F620773
MTGLYELLAREELLLLFAVILLGLMLGRLEYRGLRLGTAGVLFAGLGLSAWLHPLGELELAPQIKELGLLLFVYCVGLTSGPGFFAAWRSRGLGMNLACAAALAWGALLACVAGWLFGLNRAQIAGLFCGALTNTPALGAVSSRLSGTALEAIPALAYSLTYPAGVLGALLLGRGFAKRRRDELAREVARQAASRVAIESRSVEVTNPRVLGHSIRELRVRDEFGVVVSRLRRGEVDSVPNKYTVLHAGDVITVVGTLPSIQSAIEFFGRVSSERLELRRDRVDMRRVLVSKRELVGLTLGELDLARRFNAQVTRLRRADLDLIPSDELRLELGDRLRVVAPVERLGELSRFLGDSEREIDVDYVALAVGLCVGLLLARVPIPLFGTSVTLGTAGGPLVAALIFGRLGRTGKLMWVLPYEANLSLREIGLLLFLAGVGVNAGGKLAGLMNREGLAILAIGACVTVTTSALALALMRRWGGAGVVAALGGASGLQTQPATLAAAFELSQRSEETYVAYALVYPLAMIGKILIAQLLAVLA